MLSNVKHTYQFYLCFKANLDDLEQCPFCPFATIMEVPKEMNKVFSCLNPDCGKDSCRLCGQLSHIPMRCEEMENDEVVRKRTYIENKMAEALIRHCYNCQRPYIKLVTFGIVFCTLTSWTKNFWQVFMS